ncbi:MAG: hypothetical protein V2I33_22885 [Kangiellaceae bacterium]|jgi:hypothetical protein|nr:hypothetical protein [Kangiellaceae bacterium]
MASADLTPEQARSDIEEKLPLVIEFVQTQALPDINWVELHEDLSAIFWLNPENPADIVEPVWDIINRCATSAISGTARFRILKINRVKLKVNQIIYELTNARDGNSECVYKCR